MIFFFNNNQKLTLTAHFDMKCVQHFDLHILCSQSMKDQSIFVMLYADPETRDNVVPSSRYHNGIYVFKQKCHSLQHKFRYKFLIKQRHYGV